MPRLVFTAIFFLLFTDPLFPQTTAVTVDCGQQMGAVPLRVGANCGPCDEYTLFPDWSLDVDDPASYDFTSSDAVIQSIVDGGFDILFRIGPSWHDPVKSYHNDPPGTLRDGL